MFPSPCVIVKIMLTHFTPYIRIRRMVVVIEYMNVVRNDHAVSNLNTAYGPYMTSFI